MDRVIDSRPLAAARRFSYGLIWAGGLGILAGILAGGIIIGVSVSRVQPHFSAVTILNPHFAAGEGIQVRKREMLPPNCIPRRSRAIIFPQGCYGHQPHCEAQILNDAGGMQTADQIVPTPIRTRLGCGDYVEQMSAQGCGALSGILPPLGDTSKPVAVCVMPPNPLPTTK